MFIKTYYCLNYRHNIVTCVYVYQKFYFSIINFTERQNNLS